MFKVAQQRTGGGLSTRGAGSKCIKSLCIIFNVWHRSGSSNHKRGLDHSLIIAPALALQGFSEEAIDHFAERFGL